MSDYIFSNEAEADFDAILEYIAADNVQSALDVHARFFEVFQLLAENPEAGHYRDDLTSRAVRFFPVYSYMVVYISGSKPVEIARILGAAQDLDSILG
ncbi:MAG: type II toxin-antitoxin system RelE/ParE family toxin [Candidatus Krumholzibacteriota bacterium]